MNSLSLAESARVAVPADTESVALLVRDSLDSIAESRGGELWTLSEARSVPADASVAEAIVAADQLVVVGTLDESVVGYAIVRLEELPDNSRLAVLDDLFVLPAARQVGVGEAMIGLVLQWAADSGCRGIDSAALPGDRATKNFFESNGLVARAIIVHRRL